MPSAAQGPHFWPSEPGLTSGVAFLFALPASLSLGPGLPTQVPGAQALVARPACPALTEGDTVETCERPGPWRSQFLWDGLCTLSHSASSVTVTSRQLLATPWPQLYPPLSHSLQVPA